MDSYGRHIYIHGTAEEGLIGQPASHGCVRMRNEDVIGGLGSYIAGNVVLEYFLTDERKLKVRLYGTSDIDFQSTSRRGKYGFGFGYRTEFGTLSEFQNGLGDSLEEVIDSELEEENKN